MNKEELEIDNKRLDFNEKVQLIVKKEELKEQDIRLNKLCFDYQEKEKRLIKAEQIIKEIISTYENPRTVIPFKCAMKHAKEFINWRE